MIKIFLWCQLSIILSLVSASNTISINTIGERLIKTKLDTIIDWTSLFGGSDAAEDIVDPGAGDGGSVVGGLGPLQGLLCWHQHYSRR